MQPWKIIQTLESDNSRLFKEDVVRKQAEANNIEFFDGVKLALTSTITFGVAKIPTSKKNGSGLVWKDFIAIVNKLQNRTLTGNAARDAVQALCDKATIEQWNDWYRRILIKDLRCGVSEKTINNVVKKDFPKLKIPVFSCQLAHDGANHEKKICGQKILEVKLDGVRVLTIVYPDGKVDQFSRNGKELVNFPTIKEQFSRVANTLTEPVVFDGEVMSKNFQDLMKQVHRKSNVQTTDAILYLFDMIPLKDFVKGKGKHRQIDRSQMLTAWMNTNGLFMQLQNVQIVGQQLVDLNTAQGQKHFKEINAKAIAGGYEGIMIKDPHAVYECKRSHAWLKQKPFIEVTLEVIDVEEGTGRNQGRLGALVCSGEDDGRNIVVNVGSGFSDDNRDDYWSGRRNIRGQLVEVRADAITQNQDGSYSLRFPRFLRFRGFEVGEKL